MNLLFYNDSPVFGGHEVMTLEGISGILSTIPDPVVCVASTANDRYLERLRQLAREHSQLTVETVPWHSSKLEALRNRLLPQRTTRLAAILQRRQPSLVIAIQGNIEHSSLGLLAARHLGIRCVSYIPVPHSHAEMGAKLGWLRDRFCQYLFRLPDRFITITHELAHRLHQQSHGTPVDVVWNGIDTKRFAPGDRAAALQHFQLPADKVLLGVIGRIEFRQKQQHLLVQAIASNPRLTRETHLVCCGSGPDSASLKQLLDDSGVSGTLIPWGDTATLYHALDALVIPSRYEGLPLVMIESLASGTPVIGSDRDGMKDILPNSMRFDPTSPAALAQRLLSFLDAGMPKPDPSLISQIRTEMSLEAFHHAFCEAVTRAIPTEIERVST